MAVEIALLRPRDGVGGVGRDGAGRREGNSGDVHLFSVILQCQLECSAAFLSLSGDLFIKIAKIQSLNR